MTRRPLVRQPVPGLAIEQGDVPALERQPFSEMRAGVALRGPYNAGMRLLAVTLVAMLTLVAVSCSSGETAPEATALTGDELGWCGDPNDFDAYDAIWEAADESGVASMGDFMLEKAGIETDIDPKDLAALTASLSREQIDALVEVGNEFDESDDLWLEYLATEDGTAACRTAYAASN